MASTAAAAPAATANPKARTAIAREARPRHAGGVRTAIVLRRDLDVLVVLATVRVAIFDAEVGEVHLLVKVREVVLGRPFPDLLVGPIRMAVVVGAVPIALVQP